MKVRLLLFAVLREIVGREEVELEVQTATTAGEVLNILIADNPQIAAMADVIQVAINQEFADRSTELEPGDEIALLPPLSGG